MSKTRTRWTGEPNVDRTAAVLERRRSNAAGTHGDRRTKRLRTRSAVRTRLVKEALA